MRGQEENSSAARFCLKRETFSGQSWAKVADVKPAMSSQVTPYNLSNCYERFGWVCSNLLPPWRWQPSPKRWHLPTKLSVVTLMKSAISISGHIRSLPDPNSSKKKIRSIPAKGRPWWPIQRPSTWDRFVGLYSELKYYKEDALHKMKHVFLTFCWPCISV